MRKDLLFGLSLIVLLVLAVALLMPWAQLTNGHLGLMMLALVVGAIMLGFPTAFTLMGMGMIFTWLAYRSVDPSTAVARTLDLMVQRAYGVATNDVLIAIPLFVFMGYIVERANLMERLFHSLHLALARVPGSLAVATVATCAIFATATGIVGAVVTLMGLLALPAMLRHGYDVRLAAGCITAGGCLGILIPPSVLLIVYGATAGVSVVQLYAGAFFPGFMLAGMYALYVIVLAKFRPDLAPPLSAHERLVPLDSVLSRVTQNRDANALTAILRRLFARSAEGDPRAALRQLLVASLPALVVTTAILAVYSIQSQPVEGVAEGAQEINLGDFDPTAKRAPDTVAADPGGGSAWILWTGAIAAIALIAFYATFSVARLAIFKELLRSFFPLAALIMAVLGSIVFGLATPTEAAAVGALGGLLLAIGYRQVRLGPFRDSVVLTARTTAMVCWLFVGSSIFSAAFALLGGQGIVERWVLSMNLTTVEFMLLSQVIIFLLGWPLEWTEIIVIFMPIFIPLLGHFNVDPLFFGLLVALNLQTAFLSPPVAMAAYYLKGVAPASVRLSQIFAGMMPFMVIQVIALALLYLFPAIGLWLPAVLYK